MLKKSLGFILGSVITSSVIVIAILISDGGQEVMYTKRDLPTPSIDNPSTMVLPGMAPVESAIVRLSIHGHFDCSGFVISDQYLVTAGHCIESEKDKFIVNDKDKATVAGFNHRVDYALLTGDFKSYGKLVLDVSTARFPLLANAPGVACGYPEGTHKLVCTPQVIRTNAGFFIATSGELYPGMSGGPLLVQPTPGTVIAIGVNSGVETPDSPMGIQAFGIAYYSSLIGFFGNFNLEVE